MKQAFTHSTILLLYALAACLVLSPLPAHLSEGLLAAESGDPLLQSWVLQWNIHKLSTSLTGYFDANIFYPYPNTFAYHDHLFGLGLLGFPFYAISRNPLLTYNILLLLSFVFSAYGMFLLCREITQNIYTACFGGFIFGFLPFRFAHLDHLNLLSVYWLPLCFLFLTRYFFPRSKRARHLFLSLPLFWLCYFLQALTSFNYLFLSAIALGIYGAILTLRQYSKGALPWHGHKKRDLLVFSAGAALVGLGLLPLALPYLHANKSMGFERTVQETQALSARLQDYAVAPENNVLYGNATKEWRSPTSPYPREQILFPGVLTTLLAGLGLLYGLKRTRNSALDGYRTAFAGLMLAALILSFGPFASLFGKTFSLPYAWLFHALPGFKSMRVPARFGLLVAFSLSVLASIGLSELYRHFFHDYKHRKLTQFFLTGLLSAIILLESYPPLSTISSYPGTTETLPKVYQWLHAQPEPLRIVELPVRIPKDNFESMYYSTFHWKALLNGRSAFIPNGIEHIFSELRAFPSKRSINLLESLAVDYIILHTEKLDKPLSEPLPEDLTLLRRFDSAWLFQLKRTNQRQLPPEGSISPVTLHLPSSLKHGERYTMGVELESNISAVFSPLPEENCPVQLTWKKNGNAILTTTSPLSLPVLFEKGKQELSPLRFKTPDEAGDYLVRLEFQSASFAQKELSKSITLIPEYIDSRAPHILQVEYLWDTIPEEWPQGKSLPIRISVKNSGDTLWKASIEDREYPKGETRLAVVDWYELESGDALIQQRGLELGARGVLRYDLPPGEDAWIELVIPTPNIAGEFLLELDMLSEHVAWFSPDRSQTLKKKIHLR